MLKELVNKYKLSNINPNLIGFYFYKTIYQKIIIKGNKKRKILFIVGCQRSGTSLMTRLFFKDVRVKVYRESSVLSSNDPLKLRLNPLPLVKERLSKDKTPLIVLKPLVESQNIKKLLEYFPDSCAIWLFRNYKDVVSSNLKLFGIDNGINDLKPIINNDKFDWRSEKVTFNTHSIVKKYFSELNPYDAAALFWFARNQIFYDLQIDKNQRVFMCRYEDLVSDPNSIMREIYMKINIPFPKNKLTKEVHNRSVRKGSNVLISTDIDKLCKELEKNLMISYFKNKAPKTGLPGFLEI